LTSCFTHLFVKVTRPGDSKGPCLGAGLEFIDILVDISFGRATRKIRRAKTSHAWQTPVVQQQRLHAPNICAYACKLCILMTRPFLKSKQ